MNKKFVSYLTLPVVVSAFFLTGCTVDNPAPNNSETIYSTGAPTPGQFDNTASPNPSAPPAEQANEAFPDVQGDSNMSKEEIQIALMNSDTYVADIFNNPYLESGKWVEEGMDYQALASQYDRHWDVAYMSSISSAIDSYKKAKDSGNFDMNSPEFTNLFAQVFFVDRPVMQSPNGKFDCENSDVRISCLKDEKLEYGSEWMYQTVDANTVNTTIKFSAPVRYTLDGVSGYIPIKYELTLTMVKNESADEAAGFAKFIVKGADSKVSSDQFSAN